ncbi:MAG: dTMP kinase [Legionellales bacterium]|nr:dTMP kinase [Legionellales bacterium]
MAAQYIVIEGIDGAGKTSAMQTVTQLLPQLGVDDWITTREPGGTALAEHIRQLLGQTEPSESWHPHSELLLMYASRVQVVHQVVQPALAVGQWVISDRHELSTRAYQGGGRQLPEAWLQQLHHWLFDDFWPHLTLYLDLPPEIALERARKRGALGRFEQLGLEFYTRVRNRYLQLAEQCPNVVTIDASQPFTTVQQAITKTLLTTYQSS